MRSTVVIHACGCQNNAKSLAHRPLNVKLPTTTKKPNGGRITLGQISNLI